MKNLDGEKQIVTLIGIGVLDETAAILLASIKSTANKTEEEMRWAGTGDLDPAGTSQKVCVAPIYIYFTPWFNPSNQKAYR